MRKYALNHQWKQVLILFVILVDKNSVCFIKFMVAKEYDYFHMSRHLN
jgi:hypothetical protein